MVWKGQQIVQMLKGSDDGLYSELLGFWTLFIV
jgi:hypothetical protein